MATEAEQTCQIHWEVLNPESEYEISVRMMAPRLENLRGRRIGLLWNGQPNGDNLLEAIGKLLKQKFEDIQLNKFNFHIGVSPENIKQMTETCDGIVAAIGACGSCTRWTIHDSAEIEKLGRPTVVIATNAFIELGRLMAEANEIPSLRLVETHHPIAGLPAEKIRERADSLIEAIVSGLTQEEQGKTIKIKTTLVKPEPEVIKVNETSNTKALWALNELFYENKWTDGLPIVPPTREALKWMLAGTNRGPNEIIGLIPPKFGKATTKSIAINSVMAGAEPAYLPVIMAAVEAVTDPAFALGWGLAGMQATTGPNTPLLIVNGPIANNLKIESGIDCFGRGHRANATIGRALRLILTNVGGAHPGINDMKCQGSAQEFTFCVAEKEDHPVYHRKQGSWKPLHVENGFAAATSTVTAVPTFPPICVKDFNHCSLEILNAVIDTMTAMGQEPYAMDWQYVLVLSSTHAQCLADAGMSKDDIREFIYANAVTPWGKYKQQYSSTSQPKWMARTTADSTSMHLFESPNNIVVIVAGGECGYSQIIRCVRKGVTKQIRLPDIK